MIRIINSNTNITTNNISKIELNTPLGYACHLTKFRYKPYKYIQHIEKEILNFIFNSKLQILQISIPPRHGKSEYISHWLIFWLLMNIPTIKIILTTYGMRLTETFTLRIRDLMLHYGRLRGVSLTKHTQHEFYTQYGGGVIGTGVDGALTGKGGDLILIDDPVKSDAEAMSRNRRDKTWQWFISTLYTRLEKNAKLILLSTRWHKDDLTGRIIENRNLFGGIKTINLPAIAGTNDILGRKEGEVLCPERFPLEDILIRKKVMGNFWFNALYQQNPINEEAQIFKNEYWNWYNENEIIKPEYIIQVWDTAYETKEHNSYSACCTLGKIGNKIYLLDVYRGQIEFPELKKQGRLLIEKWQPNKVCIEGKASGKSLIQELKRIFNKRIEELESMDKTTRAYIVTPFLEERNVYIKQNAPWVGDFLSELSDFPNGKHDDQVDAFTLGLQYLKNKFYKNKNLSNYIIDDISNIKKEYNILDRF